MTPKYIREKFDEIVEFSELRDFLDIPLKNYSSGMVARIAFAIATITKPDVLIADEILSVGDFMFQEKCEERMRQLMSGGTTVLLRATPSARSSCMCDPTCDHGWKGPRKDAGRSGRGVRRIQRRWTRRPQPFRTRTATRGSLRHRKMAHHHRRGSRRPARAAGPAHPPGPRRVIKTVPHNSDADSAMRFLRNMAESHGGTVPEAQGANCAVCLR